MEDLKTKKIASIGKTKKPKSSEKKKTQQKTRSFTKKTKYMTDKGAQAPGREQMI